MATFYGIGVGPGDPALLTLKAVEKLKTLDILYTPKSSKEEGSVAFNIVKAYLKSELEIKERHFPMTFNNSEKREAWNHIASEVAQDVKAGREVGFITLGDPMIYSTYVYIMERLTDEIKVETIPGISSFSNIASNHNFPLVMDKEALVVLPCTAEEERINEALRDYSCIVLMKVYRNFDKIIAKIDEAGLTGQAILVSNSSMENEEIFTNLHEAGLKEKISYFSTILINKQRTVKL